MFASYFLLFGCIIQISIQKVSNSIFLFMKNLTFIIFQHSEFFMHNFQLYTNDKYVNESQLKEKCEVNLSEKPCKYTPNVKFHMITELKNPWLSIKGVHVNDNISFVDQTFNLCTFDRIPVMNIFITVFYELFRQNINFEMKCPYKPVSFD